MSVEVKAIASGYIQQIPGGFVFEIGNDWIHRRIHCISDRILTTSFANGVNGEEYLDETIAEFEIVIQGEGQRVTLTSKDFSYIGHETPQWDNYTRTLEIKLETLAAESLLSLSIFYQARAGDNFMRKWVRVAPCSLEGWTIRRVTIENMRFKEMVEGVVPLPRYLRSYENHEDMVHSEPDKANTAEPNRRFMFGDLARSVVAFWGYGEGLFFFTESLLGEEVYHRPTGLAMRQRDFAPLNDGLTTGAATIGAYSGPPEAGFKRYNEHLVKHWCCVDDKKTPVAWNTWMVTLGDDKPLLANYTRELMLEYIDYVKEAGFFDVLHLDLGWEAEYPLRVDGAKFPNGMSEIVRKAKEAGLDMAYWVNPFGSNYWKSRVEDEHPEWLVPGAVSGRSGATAICPLTDHYHSMKERFIALATELNARVIYWDGSDWEIRCCAAASHGHLDQEELDVKAWKRLAEMCRAAHDARPDLMLVVFSIPFDNHRLCVVDQEQISDTHSYPTVRSELIQRQQIYQMTFEHPYKAMWGSWYGVDWHEAGGGNLRERPLEELIHAEMSMIGNGIRQTGGSLDFKQASAEFITFLKKLFAFRKRFEQYFDTYQHVLGFPDGKRIDGEGHIVDGRGFIVLVNPTREEAFVRVPLDEAELELPSDIKYELTDWSDLVQGIPLGEYGINSAPELTLDPLEVKYIGIKAWACRLATENENVESGSLLSAILKE